MSGKPAWISVATVLGAVAVATLAGTAQASVVLSTPGFATPPDTSVIFVGGYIADPFTPDVSATVTTVTFQVIMKPDLTPPPAALNWLLLADNGRAAPGNVLLNGTNSPVVSRVDTGLTDPQGNRVYDLTVPAPTTLTLTAGTRYWMSLRTDTMPSPMYWSARLATGMPPSSMVSLSGLFGYSVSGTVSQVQYQVDGTILDQVEGTTGTVPEPATLVWPGLAGLAALAWYGRPRRPPATRRGVAA